MKVKDKMLLFPTREKSVGLKDNISQMVLNK